MPSDVVSVVPADALDPAALHAAFADAFADYLIGPFTLPLAQWPQFTGRQCVDLALSRAAVQDGRILAFCLVAPRADVPCWRLATMGAVPAARGSGAAPRLLDDFLVRAADAGRALAELECFAQNTRALRLYEGRGFAPVHALYGYQAGAPGGPAQPPLGDVPLAEAMAWLAALSRARGDLPLQVTPPSLRAQPFALRAWRQGGAQAVFAPTAAATLTLFSLVDPDPAQADAQALVARVRAAFPDHRISVPQLQRPDLGGEALERLGFERLPLHQRLLRRRL